MDITDSDIAPEQLSHLRNDFVSSPYFEQNYVKMWRLMVEMISSET